MQWGDNLLISVQKIYNDNMTHKIIPFGRIQQIENIAIKKMGTYSWEKINQVEMLNGIIEREGLKLREADLKDISWVLYKDKEGQWTILVNQEDSDRRKVFTIAHELGHYFLHAQDDKEFIDGALINSFNRDEVNKYQIQELEANEFAGSLIMPRVVIEEILWQPKQVWAIDEVKIIALADKLKVSPQAMATRLKNLNYELWLR